MELVPGFAGMTRLVTAVLIGLAVAFAASAETPVPKLTARVMDQTGTLTAAERDALEEKLRAFEAAKGRKSRSCWFPRSAPR